MNLNNKEKLKNLHNEKLLWIKEITNSEDEEYKQFCDKELELLNDNIVEINNTIKYELRKEKDIS